MTGTVKQDADGMAEALADLVNNVMEQKELLGGMEEYDMDSDVAKIRIAYSKYLG
jgi:methyl-galactoside transport system substrate-binding protein